MCVGTSAVFFIFCTLGAHDGLQADVVTHVLSDLQCKRSLRQFPLQCRAVRPAGLERAAGRAKASTAQELLILVTSLVTRLF